MSKSIKLVAGVALLGLAYGATAWYMGGRIEAQLRDGHEHLTEYLGMPVTLADYQRGLLHSVARTQVVLPPEWGGATITLRHQIEHGPLPGLRRLGLASIESQPELSDATRALLQPSIGTAAPVSMHTRIGWSGDGELELASLDIRLKNPDDAGEAQLLPLQYRMRFGADLASLDASLQWPGMQTRAPNGERFQLQGLSGTDQYVLQPGTRYTFLGRSDYRLERLLYVAMATATAEDLPGHLPDDPDQRSTAGLALRDVQLQMEATEEGGLMDMLLRMSAQELQLDGEAFAPLQWDMSLRKTHVPTYEQFYAAFSSLLQSEDPVAAFGRLDAQEQERFRQQAAALFAHGLELRLDELSFRLPEGVVRADASVSAPTLTANDLSFLPFSLLAKLQFQAHLSVPEAALVRLGLYDAESLQALVDQGVAEREGDALKTAISYLRGLSTINGQPVDPAALGGLLPY
ncbi:YdgA family protein [Corticibacter populi]|nr:YdgA family protein [Corticibacter populi]RZS30764.1 uncharacterized protein YdgA (DUF945 family) [Corticibacter populi]